VPVDPPFRVLVICTGNRARSQMVHGWLRHLGGSRLEVESTGTRPKGVPRWQYKSWPRVGSTPPATPRAMWTAMLRMTLTRW
jgi:hypothetical protein